MSEKIQAQLTIAATPKAVFKALTQVEDVIQWFAEHADISIAEKRYDFWGRFTPEVPDRNQGRHTLLALEPDRRLKFSWKVRGAETTVEFSLEPQGQSTKLTLLQEGLPQRQTSQYSFADFWDVSLENLRSWVGRKTVGERCDFSVPKRGNVRLSIDINAPRETVFEALVNPAQLERYIAEKATVEPRVGGQYSFGWKGGGPVKILDLVPTEKLSYSWTYDKEQETVVTWTLEGSGGKTQLVLVHSGFAPDRVSEDYGTGWMGFLNRIKAMVESGPGWKQVTYVATDYAGVA
ncbi:SRPBCC domain-containing protein [Candidatus Acetothermia bacterium]|nr:SRPBCC domain-containing protein [Candidatus Acetothermia bacterium]MBI3660245.1 SRPBCC domain-containing protein [Candidatus Acetothermia bacterium]